MSKEVRRKEVVLTQGFGVQFIVIRMKQQFSKECTEVREDIPMALGNLEYQLQNINNKTIRKQGQQVMKTIGEGRGDKKRSSSHVLLS